MLCQQLNAALAMLSIKQSRTQSCEYNQDNLEAILEEFNRSSRQGSDDRLSIHEVKGTAIELGEDIVFKIPSTDWQVVQGDELDDSVSLRGCLLAIKKNDPVVSSIIFFPPQDYNEPKGRLGLWISRFFHECHAGMQVLVTRPHSMDVDQLVPFVEIVAFRMLLKSRVDNVPGMGHYRVYVAMAFDHKVYLTLYSSFGLIAFAKNLATFSAVISECKIKSLESKEMNDVAARESYRIKVEKLTKQTPRLPEFPSVPGESNVKKTLHRIQKALPYAKTPVEKRISAPTANGQISQLVQQCQALSLETGQLITSSNEILSKLMSYNTYLKAVVSLVTSRQVEAYPEFIITSGHLQFDVPTGWGKIPQEIMPPSIGPSVIALKPLVSAAASVFVLFSPITIMPTMSLDELFASFLEIAHVGLTPLSETVSRIFDSKDFACGSFSDAEAITQNFVLRQASRTHYRVYNFIRIGQQVQIMLYYTNGVVVFGKHLEAYETMFRHAKPVHLMLEQVAAQASAPLLSLPSFPALPAVLREDLKDQNGIDEMRSAIVEAPKPPPKKFLPFRNSHSQLKSPSKVPLDHSTSTSLQVNATLSQPMHTTLPPQILDDTYFATQVFTESMEGLYFGEGMGTRRLNKETNKMENAWIRVYLLLMHSERRVCIGMPKKGALSQFNLNLFYALTSESSLNHGVYEIESDGDRLVIHWRGKDFTNVVGQPSTLRTMASIIDDDTIVFAEKEFSTISQLKFCRVKPVLSVLRDAVVPVKKGPVDSGGNLDLNARFKNPILFDGLYCHQKFRDQSLNFSLDGVIEIKDEYILSQFGYSKEDAGVWTYCCWHYTLQIRSPLNEIQCFTLFVMKNQDENELHHAIKMPSFVLDDIVYVQV